MVKGGQWKSHPEQKFHGKGKQVILVFRTRGPKMEKGQGAATYRKKKGEKNVFRPAKELGSTVME